MNAYVFDDDCAWPRRLLHITSMTSYRWQPGNLFNGIKDPKYAAVSYTWGRWEIKDPTIKPDVRPLQVHQIDWKIPRIDPSDGGFEVTDFYAMIQETRLPHPEANNQECLEFLWLDVACIDQFDRQERDKEVGRQAKIFRGATRSYVWLRHDRYFIHQWALQLDEQFQVMIKEGFHEREDPSLWFIKMKALVCDFMDDKWFTSLWTLQESFLCPSSQIIPCDSNSHTFHYFTLKHFTETLLAIKDAATYKQETLLDQKYCLSEKIDQTGFLDGIGGNPMALLAASHNRFAMNTHDRVYGIMQVFGVKVGMASPGARDGHVYTLEELEDELGSAILAKDPMTSQLHIHALPTAAGKAWRFSRASYVPKNVKDIFKFMGDSATKTVVLMTEYNAQHKSELPYETTMGRFEGHMAHFGTFATRLTAEWRNCWFLGSARLMLDRYEPQVPFEKDSAASAAWLKTNSPETRILLLGFVEDKRSTRQTSDCEWKWSVGLLLYPSEQETSRDGADTRLGYWRRQGIFIWNTLESRSSAEESRLPWTEALIQQIENPRPPVKKILPFLKGEDNIWYTAAGIFG